MRTMNILVLSAGTRNKVLQYFKKELGDEDRLLATDCSNLAPAVYEADTFYLVPRITAPEYMDVILKLCKRERVNAVFSLIDPELSLLAAHRDDFLELGTTPVVSPYEIVETCFHKYRMYKLLCEQEIPTAKCYLRPEEFYDAQGKKEADFPVFVKPENGSASIGIHRLTTREEIETLYHLHDGLMIQEFMDGQEIGVDAYVDLLSGKCVSVFAKKKIKMRAGETDKSVSFKDEALFSFVADFLESNGFRGMIDLDIFDQNGVYYLSEVNPRFGGGYPHAYACGVNFPKLMLNNLWGNKNLPNIGAYKENVCMMKYNEVLIKDFDGKEIVP